MKLKDNSAVSSVVGEVLMIAVVAIVSALVFAFAYSQVWSVTETPSIKISLEGAEPGSSEITLVHMGGKTIVDAFAPFSPPSHFLNSTTFKNMEVRINGSIYEGEASLNRGEIAKPDFEAGDELELRLGWNLTQGDKVSVVYVQNNQVIGWWEV